MLPPIYQWMLGGPELVEGVVRVADSLFTSDRGKAGVSATTFGEAGALVHYGPEAGVPPRSSQRTTNFGYGALERWMAVW